MKEKTLSELFPVMWMWVCGAEADDISKEGADDTEINMYSAWVYGTRQKSNCICLRVVGPRPTLTAWRHFP